MPKVKSMKTLRRQFCLALISSILLAPLSVRGEAISDKTSAISPRQVPGSGEYLHGQGYGKLLIRTLWLGSVPVQGIHYVPEGTDLVFALMYAGGVSEFSDLSEVTIRRRNQKDLIDVDLEDLIEDGDPVPKLADGDVITVPFNWRKDMQTILTITSFITSITGFTLSLIALSK